MADTLFDVSAEFLERHTSFNRLEARGTLRIALKAAGIEPESVTTKQMLVVIKKLMPGELQKRDVSEATVVCAAVAKEIASVRVAPEADDSDDLDSVFGRLGGD